MDVQSAVTMQNPQLSSISLSLPPPFPTFSLYIPNTQTHVSPIHISFHSCDGTFEFSAALPRRLKQSCASHQEILIRRILCLLCFRCFAAVFELLPPKNVFNSLKERKNLRVGHFLWCFPSYITTQPSRHVYVCLQC